MDDFDGQKGRNNPENAVLREGKRTDEHSSQHQGTGDGQSEARKAQGPVEL